METGEVSLYVRGPSTTLIDARSDHPGKVDLVQTPHVSYNILPRAEPR